MTSSHPGQSVGPSTSLAVSAVLCIKNEQERLPPFIVNFRTLDLTEIVVVDGGSSDDSRGLIRRWAQTDHRVKPLYLGSVGLLKQRVTGIQNASNPKVLLLDVDDQISTEALAGAVEELELNALDGVQFGLDCGVESFWQGGWSAYFSVLTPPEAPLVMLGRPAITHKHLYTNMNPPSGIFGEDTWVYLYEKGSARKYSASASQTFRSCPNSLRDNYRQFLRYGATDSAVSSGTADHLNLLFHALVRIPLIRGWNLAAGGKLFYVPFLVMMGVVRGVGHISAWFSEIVPGRKSTD